MEALMATVRGNPVAWADFYKTARWQRLRKLQLARHPLCKFCLERGIVTAANVVDHVVPHKGDWAAFVTGELQSLCEPCHKSAKRQIELRGYRTDIGLDGYPLDPNHPFNRAR
jgi:5-methylcytosine-specific restriction endonuclease McrA